MENNTEVKKYCFDFVPNILKKYELFSKVYGKDFAYFRMNAGVKNVYTNEKNSYVAGVHSGNNIILFKSGKDDALLSVQDIDNDESLKETILHECIHAILTRDSAECRKLGLSYGTGLLERRETKYGVVSELGRGLNEGFTEWLCGKCGLKPQAYGELRSFVNQLELAIGEKKTLSLGKGDIKNNITKLLDLFPEETAIFLSRTDQVYKINDSISHYTVILRALDYLKRWDGLTAEEVKEANRIFSEIQGYYELENKDLLNGIKSKEDIDSNIELYSEKKKESNEYLNVCIGMIEEQIFEKYFEQEFDEIYKQSEDGHEISEEMFLKYCNYGKNILSSQKSENEKISEFLKKLDKVKKRFIEQENAKNLSKLAVGELNIQDIQNLVAHNKLISEYRDINFFTEMLQQIEPSLKDVNKADMLRRISYAIKTCNLEEINQYSIIELESLESYDGKKIFSPILLKSGKIVNNYVKELQADSEIEKPNELIDFTLGEDEDFTKTVQSFLKLKEDIQSVDKDASITILDRTIMVNYSDEAKCSFYMFAGKNGIISMEATKEISLDCIKPKPLELSLTEYKKPNLFKRIFEAIKKKIIKEPYADIPNYNEPFENESEMAQYNHVEDRMKQYELTNYNELLRESKKEMEERKNNREKMQKEMGRDNEK